MSGFTISESSLRRIGRAVRAFERTPNGSNLRRLYPNGSSGGATGTGGTTLIPALLTHVRCPSGSTPIYAWEEAEIDGDGAASAKSGGSTSEAWEYDVAEETINDAGGTSMTAPADGNTHTGDVVADETTVTVTWNAVGSANAYWVYVGSNNPVDPEDPDGYDIYDSDELDSATLTVDATSIPVNTTVYVTIWWKIGSTWYWNRWSLDVATDTTNYAVLLEDINGEEIELLTGLAGQTEIADGNEDTDTALDAPVLVRLANIGGRYVGSLAPQEFYGLITDEGPSAEADYSDERYWVTVAKISSTSGADTTALAFSAVTGDRADTITATNLAEVESSSHEIAVGTPVRVRQVRVGTKPHITRYEINVGGATSLEAGSPPLYVEYIEEVEWDDETCELTQTVKWMEFTPFSISGTTYYMLKEVHSSDPT
jgi:hypothetical protein